MASLGIGPLIHLWGIPSSSLPPRTASPADLTPFLTSLLEESLPFIDSLAPKTGTKQTSWKSKGTKRHPESTGAIDLFVRAIPAADLKKVAKEKHHTVSGDETWAARRSVHEDAAKKRTASWEEFVDCLKDRHAETEDAFTDTVVGANTCVSWSCEGIQVTIGSETWRNFTLNVVEMRHAVGRPVLKDRTFVVLQLAASTVDEFVVISLPVPGFEREAEAKLSTKKDTVVGAYAAVERVHKMGDGQIEWLMGTASDAGGVLPQWIQNIAVIPEVAKDVSRFLGWLAKERDQGKGKGAGVEGQSGQGETREVCEG